MPETYGYGVDEERARATIRAILDGPVNILDTSNNYGLGRSEERIGAVIRGSPRVVASTAPGLAARSMKALDGWASTECRFCIFMTLSTPATSAR
jgi:aryl-alcohol dehydrogenase-like predicted oxidoreductase